MADPITLYGMKISMFTGKARSYLIKQGIAFNEVAPVNAHFQSVVIPQIGRRIIPVIETSDGTIIQDTTDIIDHFEAAGQASQSAYPAEMKVCCVLLCITAGIFLTLQTGLSPTALGAGKAPTRVKTRKP